jgi:hypothetical protein
MSQRRVNADLDRIPRHCSEATTTGLSDQAERAGANKPGAGERSGLSYCWFGAVDRLPQD